MGTFSCKKSVEVAFVSGSHLKALRSAHNLQKNFLNCSSQPLTAAPHRVFLAAPAPMTRSVAIWESPLGKHSRVAWGSPAGHSHDHFFFLDISMFCGRERSSTTSDCQYLHYQWSQLNNFCGAVVSDQTSIMHELFLALVSHLLTVPLNIVPTKRMLSQ